MRVSKKNFVINPKVRKITIEVMDTENYPYEKIEHQKVSKNVYLSSLEIDTSMMLNTFAHDENITDFCIDITIAITPDNKKYHWIELELSVDVLNLKVNPISYFKINDDIYDKMHAVVVDSIKKGFLKNCIKVAGLVENELME